MLHQDLKYPVYCVKIKFPFCKNIRSQGRVDTWLNTLLTNTPLEATDPTRKIQRREYSPSILPGVYEAK